jgi:putative heme-binding domain-containing protein
MPRTSSKTRRFILKCPLNAASKWGAMAALLLPFIGTVLPARAAVDERTRVALEALGRLKGADFEGNPALKKALERVLNQVRGEPEFIGLVRDFKLTGQETSVRAFLLEHPDSPAAVDAARVLLEGPQPVDWSPLLGGKPVQVVAVLKVFGETEDRRLVPGVLPLVSIAAQPSEVRRAAVGALARVQDGAAALMALSRSNLLSDDLRFLTGNLLRASRWPAIRSEAAQVFPAPAAKGTDPLPPMAELVRRTGDATRGAAVFRRADVGCIQCHQVNGEGIDFGPKLSEIGTKLGKEALAEAVLDPSAGISFGFEAWAIQLKNGDDLTGLIVGETEDELAVKIQGGTVNRLKKAEIARREKQALSIMPAGLQQAMTTQEFVDLLEYLVSLKKATR